MQKIIRFIQRLPLGANFIIGLVAFKAGFKGVPVIYSLSEYNKVFSDDEIENIFADLDEESVSAAKRFMKRQLSVPYGSVFIHPKYFLQKQSRKNIKKYCLFLKKSAENIS